MNTRSQVIFTFLLLASAFLHSDNSNATTYHVLEGESISDALSAAQAGDEVLLDCGTYWEQGLIIPEGVYFGVWSGTEGCTQILSDGGQPLLILTNVTEATRIVGISFRLDPFVTEPSVIRGGGVYCENASPVFENASFEGFQAIYGGAVYCRDNSNPAFLDCNFKNNSAFVIGGAFACVSNSSPQLSMCLIEGNSAGSAGGSINAANNSNPIIEHCTFVGESSEAEASHSYWDHSNNVITSSILMEDWTGDVGSYMDVFCSNITAGVPLGSSSQLVIHEDPLFCGIEGGEFSYFLQESSPCCEQAMPECGGMGAFPCGCDNPTGAMDEFPEEDGLPTITRIGSVFPNPFNPKATIRYELSKPGSVKIQVFDLAGRLVKVLVAETREAGHYETSWLGDSKDGRNVAAGIYFLQMQTETQNYSKRVVLVK